jgi:hypothetical protein
MWENSKFSLRVQWFGPQFKQISLRGFTECSAFLFAALVLYYAISNENNSNKIPVFFVTISLVKNISP